MAKSVPSSNDSSHPQQSPAEVSKQLAQNADHTASRQAAGRLQLPWYRNTLTMALLGAALMAISLPPLDIWPLGWIAPIPWLLLIRAPELLGWRPYRAIYIAGFVFWLYVVHWLRLPHPATSLGWLALALYLAFYIPMFIGISRVGVHRLRIPLIVTAPLVWTGIELVKGHMLGGFTMGSLGHTQHRLLPLIQIADTVGAYGVSGLVMFVAACLTDMLPSARRGARWWPILPAAGSVVAAMLYGQMRCDETLRINSAPEAIQRQRTVALIQGSIDSEFKAEPDTPRDVFRHYDAVTRSALDAAAAQGKSVDLIVWPETMYRYPLFTFDRSFVPPPDMKQTPQEIEAGWRDYLGDVAKDDYHRPLLFGVARGVVYSDERQTVFNSAAFVDSSGNILGTYDKQGLVMFGEYVPFADRIPFLYKLTPLAGGAEAGREPLSVDVHGLRYSPSICFETVIPHLIAGQVRQLRAEGREPDVLVNLTNDGWFWGSSELDLHLNCGIFRAIENRKPLLIAANTGFSAWIDASGRVVEQSARRQTGFILADVRPDGRQSFYMLHGDVFAGACLTFGGVLAAIGLWNRVAGRKTQPNAG